MGIFGRIFEKLLGLRNDVGLLSEEYDTDARRLVGNTPQAFSMVGPINSAYRLANRPDRGLRRFGAIIVSGGWRIKSTWQ